MPDQSMPPLGPPYGPAGPPPPPIFPERPPVEWAPRPIGPVPSGVPPTPPTPDRRVLAIVGGVIVLALIAAGLVAWTGGDNRGLAQPKRTTTTRPDRSTSSSSSDASTDSTDSTDSSSSTTSTDLEQVVKEIEAFVEKERGLTFKGDVPVELASDTQFTDQLFAGFEESVPAIREEEEVLKALGLVTTDRDLVADQRALLTGGVLGFYDPKDNQLVVRGDKVTPFVRQVLAHELTHALDDQWFNLDRPELDTADDETGTAFVTLAEGDARSVENAYVDKVLTPRERIEATAEEQATALPFMTQIFALPPVIIALLQFPYDAGSRFVGDLLDAGGNTRLNDAFAVPPTTTDQVLASDKYFNGEGAVAVADPAPSNALPASNRGALGVEVLNQLLEQGLTFDATQVDPALDGWGGDRYVTWTDGARTCITDAVVGDDATATGRMLQRFQDWSASPGVTAQVTAGADPGSPFTITSCT